MESHTNWMVGGSRGPTTIHQPLGMGQVAEKKLFGSSSDPATLTNESLHRQNPNLWLNFREQRRLITVGTLKGRDQRMSREMCCC